MNIVDMIGYVDIVCQVDIVDMSGYVGIVGKVGMWIWWVK